MSHSEENTLRPRIQLRPSSPEPVFFWTSNDAMQRFVLAVSKRIVNIEDAKLALILETHQIYKKNI
jgi:hypothetical protein